MLLSVNCEFSQNYHFELSKNLNIKFSKMIQINGKYWKLEYSLNFRQKFNVLDENERVAKNIKCLLILFLFSSLCKSFEALCIKKVLLNIIFARDSESTVIISCFLQLSSFPHLPRYFESSLTILPLAYVSPRGTTSRVARRALNTRCNVAIKAARLIRE